MEKQVNIYAVSKTGILIDKAKKIWLNTPDDFTGNLKEKINKGDILKVQLDDSGKMIEWEKIGSAKIEDVLTKTEIHPTDETIRAHALKAAIMTAQIIGGEIGDVRTQIALSKEFIKDKTAEYEKFIRSGSWA